MSKKQTGKGPIEGELLENKQKRAKYDPKMCDIIKQVGNEGGGVAKMCKDCGIGSYTTFYRWLDKYPEFHEAYEEAKLGALAFYEEILLAGALGRIKGFNFNSMAMIMNNKFPEFYKRGTGQGANTEINIGSINSIDNLSSGELDKKIEMLQKKLNLIPGAEGSDE